MDLDEILRNIPSFDDPNILIGSETKDDAGVYMISDEIALVLTVDLFPPIVDDPYVYGAISAANSMSDVWAMGGRPVTALSIVGFPEKDLPRWVLGEILKGAAEKCAEAGIGIIGGHTIRDNEPKFGLSVIGVINPRRIIANKGAKPGDTLILTKPIGTGIITTGLKLGFIKEETMRRAEKIMMSLNKTASELMIKYDPHSCTDITGFGLLGHLKEMMDASGTGSRIFFHRTPLIEGIMDFVKEDCFPGGAYNNLRYVNESVIWAKGIDKDKKLILCDPQTSGGLLIIMEKDKGIDFLDELKENGIQDAAIIGEVIDSAGKIIVEE